ncbi:MAG: Invasion associated locus B family protein [Pseudolabrys sp.]|nr:Invasion associated locus B family protein [Pseudolabrys sp.]
MACVAALVFVSAAQAQTDKPAAAKPAAPAAPAAKKPEPAKPAAAAPKPAAAPAAAAAGGEQPVLLGQFGDWGAYKATPGGKTVCFALAKPSAASTEPAGRSRDASYMFVSTRPAEKVRNEVSAIVGYPQKASTDATATIGSSSYAMYTQNDGAWIKNAAEEAQMVDTMKKGGDLVVRSVSGRGTKSTDTYSLKGLAEALDKVAQECK